MDPKPRPQRELYLEVLRRMTPGQRLAKAMELSELGKRLMLHGIKRRYPDADDATIHSIFLDRLAKCHNRNY